jgi:hypothetical protein
VKLAAVALFGSQARGNAAPSSDVDILVISGERAPRHRMMGNVSFFVYPWRQLHRDAKRGDLFLCHIVNEARSLYDPENRLGALRDTFQFKTDYNEEVTAASDLGWYILRYHGSMPRPLVTKRIAWCVRTILIARASETRTPYFGALELAAFSGSTDVRSLIDQKADLQVTDSTLARFERFLVKFGTGDPKAGVSRHAFAEHFKARKNKVALQTLGASASYAGIFDVPDPSHDSAVPVWPSPVDARSVKRTSNLLRPRSNGREGKSVRWTAGSLSTDGNEPL